MNARTKTAACFTVLSLATLSAASHAQSVNAANLGVMLVAPGPNAADPTISFAAWAAAPGVQAVTGDFNGDGLDDVALVGGAGWATIPVAFSQGDGTFAVTNNYVTDFAGWAQNGTAHAVVGDFNGDGKADIALVGGAGWTTLPIAFSQGPVGFQVTNDAAPDFAAWAQAPGVQVLAGDFNGDGRADVALTGPAGWTTLPIAFSTGGGGFNVTNASSPAMAWCTSAGARAIVGDFNGDHVADIALTGVPGWTTIPVAFYDHDGGFAITNNAVEAFPGWASQAGARVVAGDFNGDGQADLAVTGSAGSTQIGIALSTGTAGTFTALNRPLETFTAWAAEARAVLAGRFMAGTAQADLALTGGQGWTTIPIAVEIRVPVRGEGGIEPAVCPIGQVLGGVGMATCYPPCAPGYTGRGPVCWSNGSGAPQDRGLGTPAQCPGRTAEYGSLCVSDRTDGLACLCHGTDACSDESRNYAAPALTSLGYACAPDYLGAPEPTSGAEGPLEALPEVVAALL